MSYSYADTVTLETIACGGCGITYAVPAEWRAARIQDHKTFHCPNGCQRHYPGKTEAEKLREQLERAEGRITHLRDQYNAADRSARAYKGQVTQLRKRVSNGVCPCCRRSFANLARHMSGQHPDYAEAES